MAVKYYTADQETTQLIRKVMDDRTSACRKLRSLGKRLGATDVLWVYSYFDGDDEPAGFVFPHETEPDKQGWKRSRRFGGSFRNAWEPKVGNTEIREKFKKIQEARTMPSKLYEHLGISTIGPKLQVALPGMHYLKFLDNCVLVLADWQQPSEKLQRISDREYEELEAENARREKISRAAKRRRQKA